MQDTDKLNCRPYETPIDPNHQLQDDEGDGLIDVGRIVEKLINLLLTRTDISYAVGIVSQFMHTPMTIHFRAAYWIVRYLNKNPDKLFCMVNTEIFELKPILKQTE